MRYFITTERPVASIGEENAHHSAFASCGKECAMIMRRQFTQTETQEKRLTDEAEQLRKLARGTPPGVERDRLLRRARQCETNSRMGEWMRSAELRPPG